MVLSLSLEPRPQANRCMHHRGCMPVAACRLQAATYIERIKRGLQKGLSKLSSWFSGPAQDDDDLAYDRPLCTKAEFIVLHHRPSAKHQAVRSLTHSHAQL